MIQQKKNCLTLILAFWLLSACTPPPEAAATIAVARATSTAIPTLVATANQTIPTPTTAPLLTATMEGTVTPLPPPTATPTWTPISTQDVQATVTAYHATLVAEDATIFAPTTTLTPSPTFTPIPGPVWPILFSGVPCPQWERTCDDSLYMSQSSVSYLINSDGSNLTPLTKLSLPANLYNPVYSADGTQMAYLADFEPEGLWHLFLANADGSEPIDLGAGKFYDFQFVPEEDCLHTVQFVSWAGEGQDFVIEKRCAGRQPQELEAVTFPVFSEIHFSPQGDALLAYGYDAAFKAHLLVHEIGGNSQEIFVSTNEYFTGAARWLSGGEQIEFAGTGYLSSNNMITTTFNLIERDGDNLQLRLSVADTFDMSEGDWSPSGQEFVFTFGHDSETPDDSGLYILYTC